MHEALELGRQDHVHEHEGQREGDDEIGVRFRHRLGLADEFPAIVGRQVHLADMAPQDRDGVAQRHVVQVGGDHDLPLAAEAVDRVRALARFRSGRRSPAAPRRRPVCREGTVKRATRLAIVPLAALGPQPDVVLLVEFFVFADRFAADQGIGRGGDGLDRHAQVRGPFAIELDAQLGLAQREARVDVDEVAFPLHPGGDLAGNTPAACPCRGREG